LPPAFPVRQHHRQQTIGHGPARQLSGLRRLEILAGFYDAVTAQESLKAWAKCAAG